MTDFSGYLRSISAAYEKWWEYYTLTDLETDRATGSPFGFELMVETVTRPGRDGEEKRDRFPVLQGLYDYVARETQVLLVGRPGSGKSVALRRLLWEEAGRGLENGAENFKVPVLIRLRTCEQGTPSDWIADELNVEPAEVKQLLRERRLLLLFDGLNEAPSEAYSALLNFRQKHLAISMVFTTRDTGADLELGVGRKLELLPFKEPQKFIRWLLPEEQASKLEGSLKNGLRDLTKSPLLLRMLCDVFAESGEIPKNRGELFQKEFIRRYKKHQPQRERNISDDSRRFTEDLLKHLAFAMLQGSSQPVFTTPTPPRLRISQTEAEVFLTTYLAKGRDPGFEESRSAREWLEDLLEWDLLTFERKTEGFEEDDRKYEGIEFHHQLFQEYYAAEWLLSQLKQHPEWLEKEPNQNYALFQQEYLNYLKWTEPVAMMLGLLPDEDRAVQVVRRALEVDLMLGARLAGEVKPKFQAQTVGFVDALEVPEWLKVELLGRTRANFAIPRLLKFVEDSNSRERRKALYALSKIGSTAIPALLKLIEGSESDVRGSAAEALGNIGSVEVIPALLKLFEDSAPYVSECAAEALANIGSVEVIPTLLKLIEDPNPFVRQSTAYVLGNIGSVEVLPALLNLIEDPDFCVRMNTAQALGNIGSVEVIPALLRFTEDSEHDVRWNTAEALGKVGTAKVIPALLKFTEDPESFVRRKAAEALGSIGSVEAIPALFKLIENPEHDVRWSAAEALGKVGTAEVIPALLKLIGGSKPHVRNSATKALGIIDSVEVIPALLKLMEDSEPYVRKSATEALSRRGVAEAIPALVKLTEDPDINVCIDALEALSEMGAVEAIPALIKVSENPGFFVLEKVARILGNIGTSAANEIAPHLHRYRALPPTKLGVLEYLAILAVQAAYKFYSYEIWQAYLTAQKTDPASQSCDRQWSLLANIDQTTQEINQRTKQMAEQPKNDFSGATFQAPVNFGDNNQGDFIHIQNNYAEPQATEAAQQLKSLLEKLRTQHPNATDAELFDILTKGFDAMPQRNPQNWQRWQDVFSVMFAGGVEATKIWLPVAGIPIEVLKRLYEIYKRHPKQLPGR